MTDYTNLLRMLKTYEDGYGLYLDAADVIERLIAERDEAKTDLAAVGRAFIREIEQHEPKHGEWIRNENGTYSCSLCQSWIPNEQHYYAEYCLHCGAKMEVQE